MLQPVSTYAFCDCPDYTGRAGAILLTNQLSLTRDREWRDSDFGPKLSGYCKHLYAVKILRGDKIEFVNDPPVEGVGDLRV